MEIATAELKDRTVDRILNKKGITNSRTFYSPISVWFTFWGLLASTLLVSLLSAYKFIFSNIIIIGTLVFLYFFIGYLIISALNRSFVLTEDSFLIVNSHLHEYVKEINIKEIKEIKIDSNKWIRWIALFGLLHSNYVEVKSQIGTERYYCLFLDVDCYDENWTKETLDTLHGALANKGIKVTMKI